jgi:tetratricopeptide (TPR) repeat protein
MTLRETMTKLTKLTTLLALLALLAPTLARADSTELAKRHYKLGEMMFNRADYAGAISQFKSAYRHSKKPALLYNIARCHESLGQHAEAIKTYEVYLESKPRDAEQIKARISNLQRLVQQKAPTPTPTPTPTPPPPPPPPPPYAPPPQPPN